MAAEILVIAAHPQLDHSRVTRRLMAAVAALPEADPAGKPRIELRDLYRRYPDYFIDVPAEQAALQAARLVVWLHPVHWYSMPPLMKLWLDEVFAFGWAYGPGGEALRGKDLWLAASTGGPEQSYRPDGYNRYFFDAFMHPYEQTAALSHMRWLPPLVLHGAHRADAAELDRHAQRFAQRLQQWPAWPEIGEMEEGPVCDVPADARPEAAAAHRLMEHADPGTAWLLPSLVYLGAAVLAVPLARLLGLGSIIGYLAAGIAIGPWGLKLVTDPAAMLEFSEFGVVLMLFLVGLELEPRRLWALRRPIFGWSSFQLLGSAVLLFSAAVLLGVDWRLALVAGLGLGMSSTAIGLSVLNERNLMATTSGQSVLSVALLQDIAAIPILAIVPLLAAAGAAESGSGWLGAAKAFGVIAIIIFGGRLLLRPALRWIARSDTPEIFTAAALLLVVATAALMHSVGLSMALGAFLAGVLLAESEYRRELETDIEPFKGLLLGLFFIAVGMSIDFGAVRAHPVIVAGVVAGFLLLKAGVLCAMGRLMPLPLRERPVFIVLLAQGGEFGFVVFQSALGAQIISAEAASLLVASVALSMLLSPLLLVGADRWVRRHGAALRGAAPMAEIHEEQQAPIIICGFGRYGQIVGRLINANGLSATVLDHDAEVVEGLRKFGWPTFYGDATRLDLLRTAGAARAKVIVVAIDDVAHNLEVVDLVREHFPQATLVARARNATHWYGLHQRGVTHIERETLDSALASGRTVLELMGWQPHAARHQAMRFRRHSIEMLQQMAPHQGDEKKLISIAKQGRQELEEMWSRERQQRRDAAAQRGAGWTAQAADEPGD